MKPPFVIVGPGRVGQALARLLVEAGYPLAGVVGRTPEQEKAALRRILGGAAAAGGGATGDPAAILKRARLVLITTPDRAIPAVADTLLPLLPGGTQAKQAEEETAPKEHVPVVLHTSGALPSSVLAPWRRVGYAVGAMHPVQTFADVEAAMAALPGSAWGVEGDPPAVRCARQIVRDLQGTVLEIAPGAKALYHAAAAVAANYLAVLADTATALMAAAGIGKDKALAALLPLMRATLGNIERLGPAQALTGPIERGDLETVNRHLAALATLDRAPAASSYLSVSEISSVYKALGMAAVSLAERKGSIDRQTADRLRTILESSEGRGADAGHEPRSSPPKGRCTRQLPEGEWP